MSKKINITDNINSGTNTRAKNRKKLINNFFKIFIIFLIGFAVINIALYVGLRINHKKKLAGEVKYLTAPGQLVEIDGHNIHAYIGGDTQSDNILVFLHSDGVMDDSIALLPLYEYLDDCKIVYIDRSGYGFSDTYNADKSISGIVNETRQVLDTLEIKGSYTLVALGTAGIEAFYWANQYPDEINSIIGVNMNYPEQFLEFTTEQYCGLLDRLMVEFVNIGGHRLIKNKIFPNDEYGIFTDDEMNTRKALAGKNLYTMGMYEEQLNTVDNAKKVYDMGIPDNIEIDLIYNNPFMKPFADSNEEVQEKLQEAEEQGIDVDYEALFNDDFRDYFKEYKNINIIDMEGPGRLYLYNPRELADIINGILQDN